jgi:hypothetical protein
MGEGDEQADATALEVGAYVERKYTASRPPERRVVVMGKWTVAGCVGWLILRIWLFNCSSMDGFLVL